MHRVTRENLDIASLDSLRASVGQIGYLLRPKRTTRIRIQSLLPSLRIPELGTIVNVLAALGPVGTFAQGTSGSIWAIDDDPAGLQIAASTTGYRLGFSQAITSTLVWAETALQNHHPAGIHPESFKLIEIF